MTKKTSRRPFWLTEPCPPWCEYQGTHADDEVPPGRFHFCQQGTVDLVLAESGGGWQSPTDGAKVFIPPYLSIGVCQDFREISPHVVLGFGETNNAFDLTADEARAVADYLIKAADRADDRHEDHS